jgi:hypothetical protein
MAGEVEKMCDTFEDLECHVQGIETVQELFLTAFGLVHNTEHAGFLMTGTTLDPLVAKSGWGSGKRFGSTIFYLKSSPPGRFGRPLRPGEVRTTATCATNVKTGRKAVSVAKIYSTAGLVQRALLHDSDAEHDSVGPLNLHLLPLVVYQDHLWRPSPGVTLRSKHGSRMVVPSTTTVKHAGGDKVFASFSDFQVAAGMAGMGGLGDAILRPSESLSETDWKRATSRHMGALLKAVRAVDSEDAGFFYGNLIAAARVVCEDLSAAGLVDLIGTPYLQGALPDSLTSPHSILSVIAAMTRLAAHPERFGAPRGTMSDSWAAAEVAASFQSSYAPVSVCNGEEMMAIDLALVAALNGVSANESGCYLGMTEFLLRSGCGLCIDVCAPRDEEQPYTCFGMSSVADEVVSAHIFAAQSVGLGKLASPVASTRSTPRAERQNVLLRILDAVEVFLRCGDPRAACAQADERDADGYARVPTEKRAGGRADTNVLAMNAVQSTLQKLLCRGPGFFEESEVSICVVSSGALLGCADCGTALHVLESGLFPASTTNCAVCLRPFCFLCGETAVSTCRDCSS